MKSQNTLTSVTFSSYFKALNHKYYRIKILSSFQTIWYGPWIKVTFHMEDFTLSEQNMAP